MHAEWLESNPLFTSQHSVGLSRHCNEGHRIPIRLPYEIDVELSCPIVGYILFFRIFGTNRTMNMMAEFMEEDMAKENLSEKKGCWHSLNPIKNLVNSKLDVRRVIASLPVVASQYAGLVKLALA
jgi:hypothetical protein